MIESCFPHISIIKQEHALIGRTFCQADIDINKNGELELTAECGAGVVIKGKQHAKLTRFSSSPDIILGAPILFAEWRVDMSQRQFFCLSAPDEGTTILTLRTVEKELSIVWRGLILEGEDLSLAECLYYPSQDLSVAWKFWDEEPEQGDAGRKPNEPTL